MSLKEVKHEITGIKDVLESENISVDDPNFAIYKKLKDGSFIPFNDTAVERESIKGNNLFDKNAQLKILEEECYEHDLTLSNQPGRD